MKPGTASAWSPRRLGQARAQIRHLHYSLSTEKPYLYWVKFSVRLHGRNGKKQEAGQVQNSTNSSWRSIANDRERDGALPSGSYLGPRWQQRKRPACKCAVCS
jgi:hypothetical protein